MEHGIFRNVYYNKLPRFQTKTKFSGIINLLICSGA